MADSREPPPLFNDDDDSHKDDDNEDLFTSAVQSPVSEQTTPEDCRRQEGAGDPLTSSPPAASLTPDPPVGGHSDFFESSEEATEAGFSSVPLEHPAGGGGTQQVSTEAQDPAPSPSPSPSSTTPAPFTTISPAEESFSTHPQSTASNSTESCTSVPPLSPIFSIIEEPQSNSLPITSHSSIEQPFTHLPSDNVIPAYRSSVPLVSAQSNHAEDTHLVLQSSCHKQEFSPLPPPTSTSSTELDFGMTLPQELSSELAPTLVDAPSVDPANMNSFKIPAEEANSLDAAPNATVKPAANGAILDDQSPNSNDDIVDAADSASKTTDAPTTQKLDTDPTSMHDALTFLGDGDTTEISLDDNTQVWTLAKLFLERAVPVYQY